jgi:metal-responsive CopG/Arc/MetJ family transcriptional regulator
MRTGKSISLDSELWLKIEQVRKEKSFLTTSEAVEYLVREGLKKIGKQ